MDMAESLPFTKACMRGVEGDVGFDSQPLLSSLTVG
jgi:hypothetical protein